MAISIAMVALGANSKVSGSSIPKAWAKRWPKGVQLTDGEKKDHSLSFRADDVHVIFGLMGAPIPWSDIEPLCTHAPFWPEAASEMKQHARHIIVTVMSEGDRVNMMKIMTQATIALIDASEGVVGVYWCNSSLMFPPDDFAEIACEFIPGGMPLPIWVNFCVSPTSDGASAGFTKGLGAFDLMELEATKSPEPAEELRNRFLGLADYLITNGPVIKDGDTVGEDANEKIKVTYESSAFGAEGRVMLLTYGGSPSGSLKMTTYGYIHALATLICTVGFGYLLYTKLPFLPGSFLRHFLYIPMTLIFGFVLLLASDKFLETKFGWQVFEKRES